MKDSSFFLTVPKGKIHFKSPPIFDKDFHSSKPLVVFLHGGNKVNQNTEHWNPIIDLIKKLCIPIRFDFLGHGLSNINQKLADVDHIDQIESVEFVINHILNKSNFDTVSIIGRSYGGAIAQKIASNNPEKIKNLGLIASVAEEKGKPILTNWKKPINILWDVKDPIIPFSETRKFKSTNSQINLFVIGNTTEYCYKNIDYYSIPNYTPTHLPEIHLPSFFEEFLSYVCNR